MGKEIEQRRKHQTNSARGRLYDHFTGCCAHTKAIAFILSITAQAAMILRYSFNWWLWILSNFVWLTVNLMSGNYIFAIQTMVYQVNSFVGLYEWYRSEQELVETPTHIRE